MENLDKYKIEGFTVELINSLDGLRELNEDNRLSSDEFARMYKLATSSIEDQTCIFTIRKWKVNGEKEIVVWRKDKGLRWIPKIELDYLLGIVSMGATAIEFLYFDGNVGHLGCFAQRKLSSSTPTRGYQLYVLWN